MNKWLLQKLFAKTNEQARSELDLFIIMRAAFYENFEALHLNFNRQRVKETFFGVYNFFSTDTNRSTLMFHLSFCSYFKYLLGCCPESSCRLTYNI